MSPRQLRPISDNLQANPVLVEKPYFVAQIIPEQPHQVGNLRLCGRFQFSDEKPNSVRYCTPIPHGAFDCGLDRLGATLVSRRPRQTPRLRAQRPLPSIMMATWTGSGYRVRTVGEQLLPYQTCRISLSLLENASSSFLDVRVGQLLDLIAIVVHFVLGDFAVLFGALEFLHGVATHIASRIRALLRYNARRSWSVRPGVPRSGPVSAF